MKRRDLLLSAVGVIGSAAVAGGGTAYALSTLVPAPAKPETPPAAEPTMGPSPVPHAAAPGPHWEYEGTAGPQAWGDLDPTTAVCKQGGAQSPIALTQGLRVPALPGLEATYGPTRVKVINNGHTFQVNVDKGSFLTLEGKRYELVQFHFHTPSEHTLDGQAFPLELHLVHQAADKNLAVVGVLLAEGAVNVPLNRFWDRLPKRESEVDSGQTIEIKDLLPRNIDDYLTYSGSLTTPPCTESVRWIVLKRTAEVSKSQIAAFRTVFPMNARPTQPIGSRLVLSS